MLPSCKTRCLAIGFSMTLWLTGHTNEAWTQTLDQRAWNAVWDRLARVLPESTPNESVHALRVIVPATWADRSSDDDEGLRELQNIASAIPDATFSIDPSRMRLQLHQTYSRFVLDVDLPRQTPQERREFLSAQDEYEKAFDAFQRRLGNYTALWREREAELQRRGTPVDGQARLRFRTELAGYFNAAQARLDDATADVQRFAPVANHWVQAVRRMRDEAASAQSSMRGLYGYEGGVATLRAIANDCPDAGPGWDDVSFDQSVNSTSNRSSNWNASGGWAGSFFNLNGGGGGGSYSTVITNSSERVRLRFCNLTYISLRPGDWFDISFLQAIDAGELQLKAGSPSAGRRLLGPNGVVPRMVKGAVVARRVVFEANLSTSSLNELRTNVAGTAGVRIGPFNIGGRGGTSHFSREYNTSNGGYARSTALTVPVVLAIITEPTR